MYRHAVFAWVELSFASVMPQIQIASESDNPLYETINGPRQQQDHRTGACYDHQNKAIQAAKIQTI